MARVPLDSSRTAEHKCDVRFLVVLVAIACAASCAPDAKPPVAPRVFPRIAELPEQPEIPDLFASFFTPGARVESANDFFPGAVTR